MEMQYVHLYSTITRQSMVITNVCNYAWSNIESKIRDFCEAIPVLHRANLWMKQLYNACKNIFLTSIYCTIKLYRTTDV